MQVALHGDGRVDRRPGCFEDGEELVGTRLDLVPTGADDGLPQDRPHLVDQLAVPRPEMVAPALWTPRCRSSASSRNQRAAARGSGRCASSRSVCSWPAMNPTGTILNFLAALSSRSRARLAGLLVFERRPGRSAPGRCGRVPGRGSAAGGGRRSRCRRTPDQAVRHVPSGRVEACEDDTKGVSRSLGLSRTWQVRRLPRHRRSSPSCLRLTLDAGNPNGSIPKECEMRSTRVRLGAAVAVASTLAVMPLIGGG